MDKASITIAIFLFCLGIAVGIWDIWLTFAGHPQSRISNIIYNFARQNPMVAFTFGLLAGHVFWK